jgi:hypothetical protein
MQLQEGARLTAPAIRPHMTASFSVTFGDLSPDFLPDVATLAQYRRGGAAGLRARIRGVRFELARLSENVRFALIRLVEDVRFAVSFKRSSSSPSETSLNVQNPRACILACNTHFFEPSSASPSAARARPRDQNRKRSDNCTDMRLRARSPYFRGGR